MQQTRVNVVAVVDVIAALSDGTLEGGNMCLTDDSRYGSTGRGTTDLCTACLPGQLLTWTVLPVDVQTPVEIRSIRFLGHDGAALPEPPGEVPGEGEELGLAVWSGVVPASLAGRPPLLYRLELQMYEGVNSVLSVQSPAVRCAAGVR